MSSARISGTTRRPVGRVGALARKSVEVIQRGRMIVDVATADLEASEARLGAFHETTWYFRNALAEARRSWDRLRAEFGTAALDEAMASPPAASIRLGGGGSVLLIPIGGGTYRAEELDPTAIAPALWRLTRLLPGEDDPFYYAVRLRDGSTRCDCAEWTYRLGEADPPLPCKHLAALVSLGWL